MKRKDVWVHPSALKKLILTSALFFPSACLGQADGEPVATIRVNSSLVLVDVITQDTRTAMPVVGLKKEDFLVFDNETRMAIESLDVGAQYATRPIALWLAVICNEKDWDENGSGFMRGKEQLLRPALGHLDKNDTLGVAHWCDDRTQAIDSSPTKDVDSALAALVSLSQETPKPWGTRKGELALQEMLRLILKNAHLSNPEPLPVIVFLYGDASAMERHEADNLLRDLLETSAIVFGINDGAVPANPVLFEGELSQSRVAHFLAVKTGGQFFSVEPKMFATALDAILVQVHFRYVLGFQPQSLDGKVHRLRVDLTDSAKQKYSSAHLAFRPAYIPRRGKQ